MSKFNVLVRGRNFLFEFEEGGHTDVKLTGFYVWRAVEAADAAEAEARVMDLLRNTPSLRVRKNSPEDPPMMFVQDLRVLPDDADLEKINGTGFIFFHGRGAGLPFSQRLPPVLRKVVERLWRRAR